MESKCSHPPKIAVNLNQLPPIDPLRIVNSSFNGKLNNSSTRVSDKVEKPRYNQRTKLVGSDEGVVVGDASSISSNCGNRTSTTQTLTDEQGMKKGYGRTNLYEICAAKHWKPPVFECYKEEGPCHKRMFTFKVIVEIDKASENIIECYGAPHQKKKIAADHAAKGALWYLKHIGFVLKNKNK